MPRITIVCEQCKHDGDLDRYSDEVQRIGGTVTNTVLNEEHEVGILMVEVAKIVTFRAAFNADEELRGPCRIAREEA